jgi:hypothetical protein
MDRIDCFIYLHIMKTAGTTISSSIKKFYGHKYLLDYSYRQARTKRHGIFKFTDKTEQVYPEGYKKYSVLHGHFTFGKYEHLAWPVVTFLREPVNRVRSQFFSVQNYAQKSLPLHEFCKQSANTMTMMTGGDLSKFAFVGIVERLPESLERLGKILGFEFDLVRKNVTPNKSKLKPEEVSIIKKYNREDINLYREGLKLFNRGI